MFTVVWSYIAGSIAVSALDPKNKDDLKAAEKKWISKLRVLRNKFTKKHVKIFNSTKNDVLSDENKEKFETKKKEFLKLADKYKLEANEVLKDLKEKGEDFAKEGVVKVEKLYNEQKEKLSELKDIAPEKASKLKDKFLLWAKDLKDEITNKFKK